MAGTLVMGVPFVVALLPVALPIGAILEVGLAGVLWPVYLGAPLGALCAAPTSLVERACHARECPA